MSHEIQQFYPDVNSESGNYNNWTYLAHWVAAENFLTYFSFREQGQKGPHPTFHPLVSGST